MGKRLSLAGAIGVLFTALSVAPAAAASDYDEMISCLSGGGVVCTQGDASINEPSGVPEGVHIAVVPADPYRSQQLQAYAETIAEDSGIEELILVEDRNNDLYAVISKKYNGTEIGEQLGDQGIANIGAIYSEISSVNNEPVANSNAGDGGGFPILAIVLPVVAVAALVGGGFAALKRRNRNPQGVKTQSPAVSLKDQRSVEISEDLRRELDSLAATSKSYLSSDKQELREASALIDSTLGHTYELFKRIDRKKDRQNREIAQRRYLDTVKKLNSALSPDYFEDIVRKPGLWDGADEKREDVLTALRSVDRQIIENIKQVNSSKEIEFRIAVDSLIGSEPMDVDDVFGGGNGAPRP